ncbi:ABC transporter permease subunit [Halocatena pleomorpha]|uniref:ABC transporter permease n=1 Tax=Halocatena pleomorpha TaxID=1785090 RepID=A0A3P3REC6_9EURY|nr:ABC transporter permease subunit [Halocatena pleomorpha]RRJ31846.1 ABC transporter permease [Halocatena pleomorpha]
MSTFVIARKEFEDAIRSRALIVMTTLFAAVLAMLVYYQLYVAQAAQMAELRTAESVISWIGTQMTILVPVLGTMLGYKAIVAERESGSLQLLLTLPHTRRDVVLGKFLGRSAVVVVSVLLGFALVGIQFAASSELFSLSVYVMAAVKTAIIGITFVAIAIAFSTAMRTSMMAMWGAIGLTLLFVFLWDSVLVLVESVVERTPENSPVGPVSELPDWYYLIKRLNPRHAFEDVTPYSVELDVFYLEPWFAVVILGVWLVVPLGLAYLRFERGDLA